MDSPSYATTTMRALILFASCADWAEFSAQEIAYKYGVSSNSAYNALKQLQSAGWVTTFERQVPKAPKPVTFYRASDKLKQELGSDL